MVGPGPTSRRNFVKADLLEYVGLCDINPKRTVAARAYMQAIVRSYERQPWAAPTSHEIYITKSFGQRTPVPVPKLLAGRGGGDRLRDLIFRKSDLPEYMRLPDSRAGAMSCLTGIAIRNSVDQKRPIRIGDLVRL
jgi:hypothetical protein